MAFTDNFNRAGPSLGASWESVEGTAWVIASSLYAKPVTQYQHSTMRVVGTFPADQYAEVECEKPSAAGDPSNHGPAVRIGPTGDCYYLRTGGTAIVLYKRVGGVDTYLDDRLHTMTPDTFYTMRLTVAGTLLSISVDGSGLFTFNDSSITTGNPGIHAVTGQTSTIPRFDDFASTDILVGGGSAVIASSTTRRRRHG